MTYPLSALQGISSSYGTPCKIYTSVHLALIGLYIFVISTFSSILSNFNLHRRNCAFPSRLLAIWNVRLCIYKMCGCVTKFQVQQSARLPHCISLLRCANHLVRYYRQLYIYIYYVALMYMLSRCRVGALACIPLHILAKCGPTIAARCGVKTTSHLYALAFRMLRIFYSQ